jgi:MFS family permease
VDLAVNGTYWLGAIIGTLGTLVLLNTLAPGLGWRLGFLIGPVLALFIVVLRRHLPESPRWQIMHGYEQEAERSIEEIETEVASTAKDVPAVDENRAIELRPERSHGYVDLVRVLFKTYPKRSILGASLMITQSFLFNAIFFSYTLVLGKFYNIPSSSAPWFLVAFAVGNFLGPLVLGRLFDTLGRRVMIAGTYLLAGALLAISAWMFNAGLLTAVTQTVAWCIIFFFASAGASAAYLTVSEIFPLEVRAMAIAVFFSIAQTFGALGPVLFGALIGDGSNPTLLFYGYLLAAGVMIAGGLVEVFLGIDAENKSLEDVAEPLSLAGDRS